MPAGAARDALFEPGSISWRVDRESVVLAGGTCALLMQIAHPSVAAGVVSAHSDFRADPFARLRRTLGTSWAIVFGDRPAAERAIRRVNAVHELVTGVVSETGTPYRALDPALLLWVHATLVDTALRMHDRFVGRLTPAEMNDYHLEAAEVAVRLGVPESLIPPTLVELRRLDGWAHRVGRGARQPHRPQPDAGDPVSDPVPAPHRVGRRPPGLDLDPPPGHPAPVRTAVEPAAGTRGRAARGGIPTDRAAAATGRPPRASGSGTLTSAAMMAANRRHPPTERHTRH